MTKILLIEDDAAIITHLTEFLEKEGFTIENALGQRAALDKIDKNGYDLALLDISLADGNGFAVCAAIKSNTDIPVIFLTASSDEYSVVSGLELGGDDFISKPFRPRELVSRIKNVLRRSQKTQNILEFENIKIDTARGTVQKNNQELFLSALEYRILLVFINNKGIVLSRDVLLDEIYNIAGEFVNDNTLTVYIKRLRDKIEDDPQNPNFIKTIRGLGYRFGN